MEKMPETLGDSTVINIADEAGTEKDLIIDEWIDAISGLRKQPGTSGGRQRRRRIEKVPQALRLMNQKEYDPVVVSFGPYHHGKEELRLAEEFKRTCLPIYASHCHGKSIQDLRKRVLEVIDDFRDCYVEGSTKEYDDEKFAEMMLLDGCLLLLLMEWNARRNFERVLAYEHLGGLGYKNLYRDMILLENQLPFKVLHVLMTIRFGKKEDQTKEILDTLHNFIKFYLDEFLGSEKLKDTIIDQYDKLPQPLHLLQIFRACFLLQVGIGNSKKIEDISAYHEKNLTEYARSFRSVTEIKAKGIFFRPCTSKSRTDINFKSYFLYGKLEIPPMVIGQGTKSMLLNLIAYEMCPNNPNDFRVTSYVRFMKMFIQHADDVKELRTQNILHNFMGKDDEEVVTMYKDIIAPPINILALRKVERKIQKHYNSKARTWIAELYTKYFSSPWNVIAFLAATVFLVSTLAQTYFTIYPHK